MGVNEAIRKQHSPREFCQDLKKKVRKNGKVRQIRNTAEINMGKANEYPEIKSSFLKL